MTALILPTYPAVVREEQIDLMMSYPGICIGWTSWLSFKYGTVQGFADDHVILDLFGGGIARVPMWRAQYWVDTAAPIYLHLEPRGALALPALGYGRTDWPERKAAAVEIAKLPGDPVLHHLQQRAHAEPDAPVIWELGR